MGGRPTYQQMRWLKTAAPAPIICMLDNDRTGKKGAEALWKALKGSVSMKFVRWNGLKAKDPGDLTSTTQLSDLIGSALPFPKI